jgi:hypothetical protein
MSSGVKNRSTQNERQAKPGKDFLPAAFERPFLGLVQNPLGLNQTFGKTGKTPVFLAKFREAGRQGSPGGLRIFQN